MNALPSQPDGKKPFLRRIPLWPHSLMGQMLLAIALALFVAQGLSAYLIWREQHERHLAGMVNSTAMRMLGERMAMRHGFSEGMHPPGPPPGFPPGSPPPDLQPLPALPGGLPPEERLRLPRTLRFHVDSRSPEQPGDIHMAEMEKHLRQVLESQGEQVKAVLVVERDPARDALVGPVLPALRARFDTSTGEGYPRLVIASMQQADGTWMTVRSFVPSNETLLLIALLRQTILIYLVLVGVVALILRRITRPLRALTGRLEQFAREPGRIEPLVPQGPEDMKHLIAAHNAMEARISALLDEKDVMLGAIGHDLKTPLAALRVRIEAVEDDTERARMAATIEDINRSLDDILSLARVGRPSDPVEATEISALVVDIIGEYEDMGEPVEVIDLERMVAPVRATWLRRALRNLVSNSLRYGERARVTLARDGHEAVITVDDDGPGIPEGSIALMMEPFTRLDPSRNSATGGTGLGLTLARAIADQHGGSLILANRIEKGRVVGLRATLRVPLA